MRYGFVVPFGDAREFAELAALGEQHGWDAAFTWEALWGHDAWVSMTAAAMTTRTIRLGTMLTPVSRIRPWDLASRAASLDRLSNGRLVIGAGLGALHDGWTAFERDEGRRARVRKLEECLDVYAGLLRGQPFGYDGEVYQVRPTTFGSPPEPVQKPHPPVWLVGAYVLGRKNQPSLARAARWDGLIPQRIGDEEGKPQSPEALAEVVERVRGLRTDSGLAWSGYDVVVEADSTGEFLTASTLDQQAWAQAGATWWVESWWSLPDDDRGHAQLRRRVEWGPPA